MGWGGGGGGGAVPHFDVSLRKLIPFQLQVVVTLSRLRHHADAEHVVLCGMTSSRFPPYESYVTELEVMCVGALFLTRKYRLAFDCLKLLISSHPENNVVWNMFARITAKTMDVRHHRYCIRLLLKNPDSLPLILSSGNNAFISGTYKFAIGMGTSLAGLCNTIVFHSYRSAESFSCCHCAW